MDKLELFRKEREFIQKPLSIPIDSQRSRFEINDRKISGYPIVWGEKNSFEEIAMKGCTQNSLNARGVGAAKNPILFLNQHRTSEILCRPSVLQEDDYGLYFEGQVIEGVQYADEALAQIRQNVLRQLSYGFDYVWDKTEYSENDDAFILREIKLWEISAVTFSAGDSAQLRSYRESQLGLLLDKYTPEQINDLEKLLSLRGAATSTPQKEDAIEGNMNKLLKLF